MASVTLSASITDRPDGKPVMLVYADGRVVSLIDPWEPEEGPEDG